MQRLTALSRVFAFAGCCGIVCAQASLPDLERAATTAQQQWFGLASTLDTRVSRMAPCDVAAAAAIEETHRASTTRLVALIVYIQAVTEQARQDVARARQIQKSETDYVTGLGAERTDTEQERAAISSQISNLTESVRKRVSLTVASDELRALELSVRERANLVAANATANEASLPRFESLAQALEKREAALRMQVAALEDERVKWNGYYAARAARAQVECTETGR